MTTADLAWADIIREAILTEIRRQIPNIYFWDQADIELFDDGPVEYLKFQGGIQLADRFDMGAVALAVMEAMQ